MKILVSGSTGQLGQSLLKVMPTRYPNTTFFDRQALDQSEPETIRPKLAELEPDVIINAGAFTAVDKAEDDSALAYAINCNAVGEMARYCKDHGAALLHVSTDYVFDGAADTPYLETDPTNPSSVYGASKLAGEQAIITSGCSHIIIRTAWVFSVFGQNFLKTMLRLGRERDALNVVADQIGCPTYATDLANALAATLNPIEQGHCEWGLYHYSGQTAVSWHEFAQEIFVQAKQRGLRVPDTVNPISTSAYPTPAPRPAWSVLDNTKFCETFQVPASDWHAGIDACLAELEKTFK